jgi:putative DNA methylase
MTYRKKLIEVALPLEEINKQSAREKSIRHGHPCTLHIWWARRPLAACRAVLFSSLVDDPGEYLPEGEARIERERLFRLIEQLVNWDNLNDEKLYAQVRLEIARSVARDLGVDVPIGDEAIREFLAEKAPPVLDPFCGGGSIPLEAQRLGLRAYASDLNPVAVLITKAMIEIPPRFANKPPVHPSEEGVAQPSLMKKEWRGAEGLAEDVRYYGKWMRDEAEKRIGHLYPKVEITSELLEKRQDLKKQGLKEGDKLTVIAWLWARTVKCPNPACSAQMPLVKSFWLSKKKAKKAWIEPRVNHIAKKVLFEVRDGEAEPPSGTVDRRGANCIACGASVPLDYVRSEGRAGRMHEQLMSIVAEGNRRRIYFPAIQEHVNRARSAKPSWAPSEELKGKLHENVPLYGMTNFADIFTPRQLVALTTFSDLVIEARERVLEDALSAGLIDNVVPLDEGGAGAQAYADAVGTYLAFVLDRSANYWSSLTPWGGGFIVQTFGRQALPMVWDFAEANPFSEATGNWNGAINWIALCLNKSIPLVGKGEVYQKDAAVLLDAPELPIICTDPPYYDNIAYSDLSDYFYVWLRHSIGDLYPQLFSTVFAPKLKELVATTYRFKGDKGKAKRFFEDGLEKVFHRFRELMEDIYPLTLFYAFKQAEDVGGGLVTSTGWETMLEALMSGGLKITATWPVRSERDQGLKTGTNVLASSVVLACRPRPEHSPIATRREFLVALKAEMPHALKELQQGAIAPVDMAQAAIGPGMAIFSRYSKVIEADGSTMAVRMALALINQVLDEFLTEQEGDLDPDTRWAVAWFEQYGHKEGPFGDAETLSKAKNTSSDGMVRAGILEARGGKVRLLRRDELESDWDPSRDKRLTTWEAVQYLIRTLENEGEEEAAMLMRKLGGIGQEARDLAYRLYAICEHKGWAQEALGYNMLAAAWPRLVEISRQETGPAQEYLL